MFRLLFSIAFLFTSFSESFAQSKLDTSKPLLVEYSSPAWNKNPNSNDSASIFLRDGSSKKLARIELTETKINSGFFVGHYVVSWGDKQIFPEMYIPPQNLAKTPDQLKMIEKMIEDGTLLRKPFFLRSEDRGVQTLTVFDTAEQAVAALEAYRKAHAAGNVNRAAFEAQSTAAKMDEETARLALVDKQGAERLRLQTEEKRKQDELKKVQSELSSAEKTRRQKEAKQAAGEAMKLYQQQNFVDAVKKFTQAIELEPDNTAFYYQYGVALHKSENYNKSLAVLNLAQGADINPVERKFFVGLNHLKLKEYDNALKNFDSVKESNDKMMGPAGAFYSGVVHYQKENYAAAKSNFEYVLDKSEDPGLDKQAENYIEQIANIMTFKKEQEKKFILTLSGGLQYDSNILAVSNSQLDAGRPTSLEGYRWTYGGSVEYRPVYLVNHEFSAVLAVNDMYSTNSSFSAEQLFQNTDPLVLGLTFPYKFKGKAFDKPFQTGVTPGFETIQMNQDGSGARETIVESLVLRNDNTFVMNENWFATYLLELRSDTAKTNTGGDDDQSASKITLSTVQTFFQNPKKTEAWVGELGGAQNTASGKNATFTRFDLAATYMAPWKWDTTWTGRLGYYIADYNQSTAARKDSVSSLTLGLRKPLTPAVTASLTGVYTLNGSNVAANDYKKYLILTSFSWTTSL